MPRSLSQVEDPDRDPRLIATGRATTVAMTCGQISVLTSTPLAGRTGCIWLPQRPRQGVALTGQSTRATPCRGRGMACNALSTGLRGYAPRPRGYEAGTRKGCFILNPSLQVECLQYPSNASPLRY